MGLYSNPDIVFLQQRMESKNSVDSGLPNYVNSMPAFLQNEEQEDTYLLDRAYIEKIRQNARNSELRNTSMK